MYHRQRFPDFRDGGENNDRKSWFESPFSLWFMFSNSEASGIPIRRPRYSSRIVVVKIWHTITISIRLVRVVISMGSVRSSCNQ